MATSKLKSQSDRTYTLRAIYLRESTTWISESFDPLLPGQSMGPLMRTHEGRAQGNEARGIDGSGIELTIRSCAFTNRFEFAYVQHDQNQPSPSDEEIEKAIVAKITADITVDYLVNTKDFPDEQTLSRWGSSNVMLHAWPYWREFCHSTLCRMNLPVTMMPLIQLTPAAKPPPKEAARAEQPKATKGTRPAGR